jgi:electron transfer flavoprotein beta subunit
VNIAVCVKHIPDPNAPGEMEGTRLKREGVPGALDPGDEVGVEAALQLKEAHGGEVTLFSMGPPAAVEAVRKALPMAADSAVLVSDDALEGADALATARVLAGAIGRGSFDLVLAGVESTGGYTGTMPSTHPGAVRSHAAKSQTSGHPPSCGPRKGIPGPKSAGPSQCSLNRVSLSSATLKHAA